MPCAAGRSLSHDRSFVSFCRYSVRMSRYRLEPTPEQESILLRHCAHARYVWNLGVEQELVYRPGRGPRPASDGAGSPPRPVPRTPGSPQGRAPSSSRRPGTTARPWRTFSPAPAGGPTWRKAGPRRGLPDRRGPAMRVRRVNRGSVAVKVPKVGWVGSAGLARGPAGLEVLPGDPGPGGPLARRVRRIPGRAGDRHRRGRGARPGGGGVRRPVQGAR